MLQLHKVISALLTSVFQALLQRDGYVHVVIVQVYLILLIVCNSTHNNVLSPILDCGCNPGFRVDVINVGNELLSLVAFVNWRTLVIIFLWSFIEFAASTRRGRAKIPRGPYERPHMHLTWGLITATRHHHFNILRASPKSSLNSN